MATTTTTCVTHPVRCTGGSRPANPESVFELTNGRVHPKNGLVYLSNPHVPHHMQPPQTQARRIAQDGTTVSVTTTATAAAEAGPSGFAFMLLKEHPYGREMLKQLIAAGARHPPTPLQQSSRPQHLSRRTRSAHIGWPTRGGVRSV